MNISLMNRASLKLNPIKNMFCTFVSSIAVRRLYLETFELNFPYECLSFLNNYNIAMKYIED